MGINTTLPLWVIVDIYGNSSAVEFIGELSVDSSDHGKCYYLLRFITIFTEFILN